MVLFKIYERLNMGKLLIIVFCLPLQSENVHTFYEFARAAIEEGHQVTVFCNGDATYSLVASQILREQATPSSKMSHLIKIGAKVLICQESARLRGIDLQKNLIEGAVRSSLGKLADLIEQNDRVVAFW
jgi:sulfur relay (sulfurtransferase) complex TusBCD TusD component (DsrE family)